jgi:hypothetical protein
MPPNARVQSKTVFLLGGRVHEADRFNILTGRVEKIWQREQKQTAEGTVIGSEVFLRNQRK